MVVELQPIQGRFNQRPAFVFGWLPFRITPLLVWIFGSDFGAALKGSGGEKRNLAPVVNVLNWSSDNPLKSSISISLCFLGSTANTLLFMTQINKGLIS